MTTYDYPPTASPIAASAVYADALVTARRFAGLCLLVLFLCIAGQITLFLLTKFEVIELGVGPEGNFRGALYMALYATLFLGLTSAILLVLTQGFIVLVMLSGRTVGVVPATRALILSLVLLMLVVPWQSILVDPRPEASTAAIEVGEAWRVPGVLYSYGELDGNYPNFENADWLGWARFVGWPALALLIWLMTWLRGRRGVKQALGEADAGYNDLRDEPMD